MLTERRPTRFLTKEVLAYSPAKPLTDDTSDETKIIMLPDAEIDERHKVSINLSPFRPLTPTELASLSKNPKISEQCRRRRNHAAILTAAEVSVDENRRLTKIEADLAANFKPCRERALYFCST